MKTKSIRIPDEMLLGIELVEKQEKIEESTAIRKLIRIGFENYVGNLYKACKITLRQAAKRLGIDHIEAIDLFLDSGIKGNLDASDAYEAIQSLG